MSGKRTGQIFPAFVSVGWCVIVLASYYWNNVDYYVEKISVFGTFFLRLLG